MKKITLKNKKFSFNIVISIVLASILLFSIGILFSSFRDYLIQKTLKENDYHVKIKGDLNDIFDKDISSLKYINSEYYVKFKNIYDVYDLTMDICHIKKCENIVYNHRLLSLYGISDNNDLDLFKNLILFLTFILSISVFFIIYNSFSLTLNQKKENIFLYKAIGASNKSLYKMFFKEGMFYFLISLILGFILSFVLDYFIIYIMNHLLYEIFQNELKISIYLPFIIIPLIFIFIIILLSILLPFLKIRKFKTMEIFRDNNDFDYSNNNLKNFYLKYTLINYNRCQKKYRGLIMCIFILLILSYSFIRFLNYTTNIINKYVKIPKYDIMIEANYDDLISLSSKLDSSKKTIYRYAFKEFNGYNVLITDLGGNEVINLVDEIDLDYSIKKYKPFNNLSEVIIDNTKIYVKLTDKVPFGFENELLEGRMILNLNKDVFDSLNLKSESKAFIKTKKNGIDKLIENYALKNNIDISYSNIKKANELLSNFILLIKIFIFLCIFIILIIAIMTIFNISSYFIKYRKKEFATLKFLGLTNFKISMCLFLESLIINLKGLIYAFPFILMISNGLYKNIGNYFKINIGIFDYKLLLVSFIICFILIYICMIISHKVLYRKTLIQNIKQTNI